MAGQNPQPQYKRCCHLSPFLLPMILSFSLWLRLCCAVSSAPFRGRHLFSNLPGSTATSRSSARPTSWPPSPNILLRQQAGSASPRPLAPARSQAAGPRTPVVAFWSPHLRNQPGCLAKSGGRCASGFSGALIVVAASQLRSRGRQSAPSSPVGAEISADSRRRLRGYGGVRTTCFHFLCQPSCC